MTLGERIEKRRKELGIPSQSELARRAEVGQSTLSGLIRKPYRWSPYLVQIARALNTSVEYLTGEADNPDLVALPPPPVGAQQVMMPVTLPTENALADMFEGLLLSIDRTQSVDEVARELAQLLPTGLSRMQGQLVELPRPPRSQKTPYEPPSDPGVPASAEQEHQQ
jgi:transcriptional regulator with XRE-family HTH domain